MAEQPVDVVMRPEVWMSGLMDLGKRHQTVMLQVMTNIGMGQKLSLNAKVPIPFTSEIATIDRGALGSEITFPIPDADLDILIIDQNKITPYLIPNEIRSSITMPMIGDYMRQMNMSRQKMFEQYFIAQHKAFAKMKVSVDTATVDNIGDIFLDAQQGMSQMLIPVEGRYVVIGMDFYRLLQNYFIKRSTPLGDNVNLNAVVTRAFGFDIYVSSYLDTMLFGHRRGHVFAETIDKVDVENFTQRLSLLVNAHSVFGSMATRHGEWLGVVEQTGGTPAPAPPSGTRLILPESAKTLPSQTPAKPAISTPEGDGTTPTKPAKPLTKKEQDALRKQQELEELARQAEEAERLRLEEEAKKVNGGQDNLETPEGDLSTPEGDGTTPTTGEDGSGNNGQEG